MPRQSHPATARRRHNASASDRARMVERRARATMLSGVVDATVKQRVARVELARRAILTSFDAFFHAFEPSPGYLYGRHTVSLISELQKTTDMLREGKRRYVCVCLPPRHGKSDLVSRRYPVWHLCNMPEHEVILASYNYELASEMSWEDRRLFSEIGSMFGLGLCRAGVGSWSIDGHRGSMFAAGIGGTITGRGAHVLIIDDYLKNRQEAESITVRDTVWRSFQSDLMTRLAPQHAVVIVANRWHEDDLVGRIIRRNTPGEREYDPDFPQFDIIRHPAVGEDGGWLFPERFSNEWYRAMRGAVASYAWDSQYQQNPRPRTGNMLRADRVKIVENSDVPNGLTWRRGWDLASSSAELSKDDPDYTVGTLAAYDTDTRKVWVRDVVRVQATAPERDRRILACARDDGTSAHVRIESVAGYKDTVTRMESLLSGYAVVEAIRAETDKVSRASVLEAAFESGNVHIVRGEWNGQWLSEMASFPNGTKDDQVDSLVVALKDDILEASILMVA